MLDDERNDIYIHIDKKAKDIKLENLQRSVIVSKLVFIKPMNVVWGDFSLIECEMVLLKTAMQQGTYVYFHLLSGVDLPIKSQDYIHQFFKDNKGKEFVDFTDTEEWEIEERCKYYRLLQVLIGRNKKNIPLRLAEAILLKIQRILSVNRLSKGIILKKGSQWFSITNVLASYLLDHYDVIKNMFQFTFCCDEVFLQTMLYQSVYYSNRYQTNIECEYQNMRLIDWSRGNPYIFRLSDFCDLKHTPYLFARKFDLTVDSSIVYKVAGMVADKKED